MAKSKSSISSYWDHEIPVGGPNGVLIGGTHVLHYINAGVLVLAKSRDGEPHKKTAIYLSTMEKADRDRLKEIINAAFTAADIHEQGNQIMDAVIPEGGTHPVPFDESNLETRRE